MQRLSCLCACAFALCCFHLSVTRAAWKNDQWFNVRRYTNVARDSIYRKPSDGSQKSIALSDWRISDLPVNHKGIEVGARLTGKGTAWAYRTITISHCEISDANREPGIHSDFIRIFGGGSARQNNPTSVLLNDIYIHDGDALPIIIQDGEFDSITLRDIRVENVANSPQIVTINTGSVQKITIQNCPGLRLAICGRPGSIGVCHVKNSPGAEVVDCLNKAGRSGVKIVYLN